MRPADFQRRFYATIEQVHAGGIGYATMSHVDFRAAATLDELERLDSQLPDFSRRHDPDYEWIRTVVIAPSASRPHLWVASQMAVAPGVTHIVKDLMIFNLRDARVSYASGRPPWLVGDSTTWIPIGAPWSWFGPVREFGYSPDAKWPADHHMEPVASSSAFPSCRSANRWRTHSSARGIDGSSGCQRSEAVSRHSAELLEGSVYRAKPDGPGRVRIIQRAANRTGPAPRSARTRRDLRR